VRETYLAQTQAESSNEPVSSIPSDDLDLSSLRVDDPASRISPIAEDSLDAPQSSTSASQQDATRNNTIDDAGARAPAQQLTAEEAVQKALDMQADTPAVDDLRYCPECYLPLHPDPKPEKLYIFLHALRYTTSLGTFETDMPEWASEGWTWDQGGG
jgi:hypothetical protein